MVASGTEYLVAVGGPFVASATFLPDELHGWCVPVAGAMLTASSVEVVERESPDAVLLAARARGLLSAGDALESFKTTCLLLDPSLLPGRIVHT